METNINKQTGVIGSLAMFNLLNMKPNYSALSRQYGIDRHTISKYHKEGGKILKQRSKRSMFDPYIDEISELLANPANTMTAIFKYLQGKYENFPKNYNSFKAFIRFRNLEKATNTNTPHVRYETEPGEQLQVDWKESLSVTTKRGEVIDFNIYTATLGYSRLHLFIYSKTKTTEDFIRCTIECLRQMGGKPRYILTDNMSAIVNIKDGHKHKLPEIIQFEKDLEMKIKLCKVRTPQTKGKDESSNRFIQWLEPYNKKIESEKELIEVIKKINKQVNEQVNRTTNIPPIKLFIKEKEYLLPLPNKLLLESYIKYVDIKPVPQTLLVQYQGNGYSVPKKYINKRVKLIPIEDNLYIYYNEELITIHKISDKQFNYQSNHYVDALKATITYKTDEEIEEIAKDNLAKLDKF